MKILLTALLIAQAAICQTIVIGGGGGGGSQGPIGPTGPTAPGGSVIAYSSSHNLAAGDCNNYLNFTGTTATLTLASPPSSSTCPFSVQNLGSGTLTIARNGLTINGVAADLTISAQSGSVAGSMLCKTDGTNYFCSSGVPGAQGPKGDPGGSAASTESHTASSSATLDFTSCMSSTYDQYQIEINQLVPGTNSAALFIRFSTDGGTSYDTGSNYDWVGFRASRTGSAATGAGTAGQIDLTVSDTVSSTAAAGGFSGSFKLFNRGSGTLHMGVTGDGKYNNGGSPAQVLAHLGAEYLSTSAVNAFRIVFSTGNIASGIVRCYGIPK